MNRGITVLLATMPVAFAWASGGVGFRGVTWHRANDGVLFSDPQGVTRIQIWDVDIVRVTHVASKTLAKQSSLAVVGPYQPYPYKIKGSHENLDICTPSITVRVDRATGKIAFLDESGKPFLAEAAAGSRLLTHGIVAGEQTYSSGEQFSLAQGEAIYGLGQHQQGLMNYRGSTVHLQQKNMEVAVPFAVSSNGYGILWDNPSITDVEVGGASTDIPTASLIDADGKPGGLTAEYFQGQNFDQLKQTRVDPKIDFDWRSGPVSGVGRYDFSVRWSGQIQIPSAGEYRFSATSDDGTRLYIDDKLVIDDWSVHPATTVSAKLHFTGPSKHKIRLEYYQASGEATVKLQWSTPQRSERLAFRSQVADAVDYYVIYGPDLEKVIAGYRQLTGSAPMMPRWSWGYWQCKERYRTEDEITGVVAEYRRRGIPLDGVIQDWFYWDPSPWGSHDFDPKRYPDPTKMIADVHAQHAHFMISVWAKFAPGSKNYDELTSKGLLYPITGGAAYYDVFNPEARAVYWSQMRDELFARGVDGWWLDASEPELGSQWGEFSGIKTAAGLGSHVFNAYPLMHTKAVYEGQRKTTSAKRVFILTRSAYAGQQRNSAVTWSGDISGDWTTLQHQIPAGLNFSLSGIPYWNSDIGGFVGRSPSDPDYRECFVRWFQFGSFCPMFRVHGTNAPKEMWRFGPEIQPILEKFDSLRYRLLPYNYSTSWQVTHENSTMMRALVLDFRKDPNIRGIGDQFMFGRSLLVNPVTTPKAVTRDVYLPAGTQWFNFWTGRERKGGRTESAAAPLSSLPLYVRAGSILPLGPLVHYSDEQAADPIELRIYAGANGDFTLYEDEGDGYAYEKGAYSTIAFHWDDRRQELSIGPRHGTFPNMPQYHTFRIVRVRDGHGAGIDPSQPDKVVIFRGKAVSLKF